MKHVIGWLAFVSALVVLVIVGSEPDMDLAGRVFGLLVAGVFGAVAYYRR